MEHLDTTTENPDEPSLGEIKVNHSVVASIVRLAALQIPGIVGVGAGFVDGLADLFSERDLSRRESDRGVKITEEADGSYAIEIRVVMAFGVELAKTAYLAQMEVRKQVTVMTGRSVRRIDVIIEGIKQISDRRETPSEGDDLWPGSSQSE